MLDAAGFTTSNIEWNYTRSRETNSNALVRTGVKRLDVSCKKCGHEWTALSYGSGKFNHAVGAIILQCPPAGNRPE